MPFLLLIILINFQLLADDFEWEINNEVGFDIREFHKEEAHSGQKNTYSNYLSSEIYLEISEQINFIAEPYYRYDHNDKERSLFNFKENYLIYLQGNSEVKLGIAEIFWGVTESKNLVDIINVYDGTDGDQKAKLGQSMLSYSTYSERLGIFDFYYLPFFSKKPQIGESGRLRLSKPIENYNFVYSGGAGDKVPSWAVKWEKNIGMSDFSIQAFRGNSRENSTIPLIEGTTLKYFAGYERISQIGTYIQTISGSYIFKVEAIRRHGQKNASNIRENYYSVTLGTEYLINRLFEKVWDLSLFIEYSNDNRSNDSTDIMQNDIFMAGQFLFNDVSGTELLIGSTFDMDGGGNTSNVELSSRITEDIRVTGTYQLYWSTNNKDPLYDFRRDNYFGVKAIKYF
jgi:hypothetical protein